MDSPIVLAIIGLVGTFIGAAGGVWASSIVGRRRERASTRKTTAEAKRTEQDTEQSATAYWREQVQETIAQLKVLEAEVKLLKSTILLAQEKYERRVGSLHEQLDRMATELTRANAQLETANKTISELRDTINELQERITKLLIDKVEKGD